MTVQNLMDLLDSFLEEKNSYKADIIAIEKFFKRFVRIQTNVEKQIYILEDPTDEDERKPKNDEESMQLLAFKMAWQVIIGSIARGGTESRIQALHSACNLLKIQADLLSAKEFDNYFFPEHMLKIILLQLASNKSNNNALIEQFKQYTAHSDVLFYCWKILPLIKNDDPNYIYLNNYLDLMNALPLRNDAKKKKTSDGNDKKPKPLCQCKGGKRFRFELNKVHQWMEECWDFVSDQKLQGSLLQKALLMLHDNLLPHLPRPVLLIDFLINSMDEGGAVSVLALQGVFVLMQKHNLEYPMIYNKLYMMFVPDMLTTTHKSRLFYLTDIFLSSTHLPEALVGGFLKKFSRLALVASPADAIILLHLIANLIIRHPGLRKMLDCSDVSRQQLSEDPYNIEEPDPSLSGALSSSLWEISDLKQHIHPMVANAASYALTAHNNKLEKPIAEFLDDTTDTLIQAEFKKKYKQVFLATKQPKSLKDLSEDRLTHYWDIF